MGVSDKMAIVKTYVFKIFVEINSLEALKIVKNKWIFLIQCKVSTSSIRNYRFSLLRNMYVHTCKNICFLVKLGPLHCRYKLYVYKFDWNIIR